MSALQNAFEERRNAQQALKDIYDGAEGRELEGEEIQAEERAAADIAYWEAREQNLVAIAASDEAAEEARKASGIPATDPDDKGEKPVSEMRQLGEFLKGNTEARSFEVRDNVNLNVTTATDGPELVDTTLASELHRLMVESSPILSSGVRVIRTASGEDMIFPKVTSYSAAALVAEAGTFAKDAPQFDNVTIGAYKIGMLVPVTRELLSDDSFNVAQFVMEQGAEALGRGADTYFVTGSGSSQPTGIDTGTAATALASASAITMDELIDIQHEVIAPARQGAKWMFNDATIKLVRKLKDGDSNYIWQPSNQAGVASSLFGYPVLTDPNIAALDGTVNAIVGVFGNPKGFIARIAGGTRIDRSDDFAFDTDVATFRFATRIDSKILDNTSFRTIQAAAA